MTIPNLLTYKEKFFSSLKRYICCIQRTVVYSQFTIACIQYLVLPEEEHHLLLLYQTQSVLLEQFEAQVCFMFHMSHVMNSARFIGLIATALHFHIKFCYVLFLKAKLP